MVIQLGLPLAAQLSIVFKGKKELLHLFEGTVKELIAERLRKRTHGLKITRRVRYRRAAMAAQN